ncbi:DnaJ domain-containing protein [Candidatus Gottesmanbacteria bacterium]|nr:DnaJ domain-containing protein [Candidatus Gottesmanbacteria bacterium]
MAQKGDYYEILGVAKTASAEEIKAGYRKQALQWHPDKHAGDKKEAEEKFKEINEAYQVLSDPQKRVAYDQYGHAAFEQGGMGQGPFGGFGGGQGQTYQQGPFSYTYYTSGGGNQGFDFDLGGFSDPFEIFEQFFGTASPFGGRSRAPRRKTYSLTIDFIDAVKGAEKEVVLENKKTKIKIPAGVDSGSRVRFGDFDIIIEVARSKKFQRQEDDLYSNETISIAQAAMGAILAVETIDGFEQIKIHAGTQPDTLIRLRGKGVPGVRGNGRGDLYVRLKVHIPEKMTSRQKELLKEFEKESSKKSGWF